MSPLGLRYCRLRLHRGWSRQLQPPEPLPVRARSQRVQLRHGDRRTRFRRLSRLPRHRRAPARLRLRQLFQEERARRRRRVLDPLDVDVVRRLLFTRRTMAKHRHCRTHPRNRQCSSSDRLLVLFDCLMGIYVSLEFSDLWSNIFRRVLCLFLDFDDCAPLMLAAAGDTTRNRLTESQTTRLFLIFLSHTRSHLLHQKEKRQMLSHLPIRNTFNIFYGVNCLSK